MNFLNGITLLLVYQLVGKSLFVFSPCRFQGPCWVW